MAMAWHQFVPVLVVINLLSFVGIVISTKYLFVYAQWTFPTSLMAFHQFIGAAMMWTGVGIGWMKAPETPRMVMLKLAAPAALSIGTVNLSLLYNTVSMYQMFKLLTVPLMCLFECFWTGKRFSPRVIASLILLMAGVGLVTVTEVMFDPLGVVYGLIAAFSVAAQQPYGKKLMTEYKLTSGHVMYLQCPLCSLILAAAVPLSDDVSSLLNYTCTHLTVVLLGLSSLCYVALGLSQLSIIGQTSAVTFQVVGLSKTILTVLAGIATFRTPVTPQNVGGLLLGILGVGWYSWLQVKESPAHYHHPPQATAKIETSVSTQFSLAGAEHKDVCGSDHKI